MAVSKRTRFEVLRRDNHVCRYCHAVDSPLTVDHVTPVALGGSDSPENLVAACKDCNAGKSSSSPDAALVAGVSEDAIRWTKAMRAATEIRRRQREMREEYVEAADYQWQRWIYGPQRSMIPRPLDWQVTCWRFYALDLPLEDLEDAITIACSSTKVGVDGTWSYMCGIAWKKLTELQTMAREQGEWSQR